MDATFLKRSGKAFLLPPVERWWTAWSGDIQRVFKERLDHINDLGKCTNSKYNMKGCIELHVWIWIFALVSYFVYDSQNYQVQGIIGEVVLLWVDL